MRATLIERHAPTLELIKRNASALGVADQIDARFGDAFLWTKSQVPADGTPLVVFCSPPYEFYVQRQTEMLELIGHWQRVAPSASHIVVETDERFDVAALPAANQWDVRTYAPAIIAIYATSP